MSGGAGGGDEEAAYFERLRAHFHGAPITKFVRQTMDLPTPGRVRITLHPDSNHHHGAGRIHGGVLGLVLDNAGFFACATVSGGFWVATVEYKVNLLETVGAEDVFVVGTVLKKGRHLMHAEMRADSAAGVHIASALGTYTVLPRQFR